MNEPPAWVGLATVVSMIFGSQMIEAFPRKSIKTLFSSPLVRIIVVFSAMMMATRNLLYALILSNIFVLLAWVLLDPDSPNNILHLFHSDENENGTQTISQALHEISHRLCAKCKDLIL